MSILHVTGGGRLVAVVTVGNGQPVMPCGRCRQLLWEHGGPDCLLDGDGTPQPMRDVLPGAFDASRAARLMDAAHVIRAKRDGRALTDEEIRWFLSSYMADEVAEEQASALLMAIFFRGTGRPRARHLDRGDDR